MSLFNRSMFSFSADGPPCETYHGDARYFRHGRRGASHARRPGGPLHAHAYGGAHAGESCECGSGGHDHAPCLEDAQCRRGAQCRSVDLK